MTDYVFWIGVAAAVVLALWLAKERGLFKKKRTATPVVEDLEPVSKERVKEMWFVPKKVSERKHAPAPISGKCYFCGVQTTMPYKCKFCSGLFCDSHRLPESHDCQGIKNLRRDKVK